MGAGAGIFNSGTLTILQSEVRENRTLGLAGGIQNEGTLAIIESHIDDNFAPVAGGMSSGGSLRIARSTLARNGSDSCGIGVDGTSIIENSTITRNNLGGICVGGTATIRNTTIANNFGPSFGGGLIVFPGSTRLVNVTIADNRAGTLGEAGSGGGGIHAFADAIVHLQNTILARNISAAPGVPAFGPDCVGPGLIASLGNNIIGDTTDCGIDLTSTDFVGDAGLGAFVDDGTPGGGYIPLLAESPAIDAANRTACPRTDQLGQRRVDGDGDHRARCDIGAVEFIP